jgi:hypothetical protein
LIDSLCLSFRENWYKIVLKMSWAKRHMSSLPKAREDASYPELITRG